jgi:hypothetical protein
MTNFSLINDLEKGKDKKIDPEIARIRYHRFDVDVDGKEIPLDIPLREARNFQIFLDGEDYKISIDSIRGVLRHFRGKKIRNEGEE